MNIALVHYHLRSGGVSSVLRAQAEALARGESDRIVVLAGTSPEKPLGVPFSLVPELDYLGQGARNVSARDLADALDRALDSAFPGGCDLLHVHNPLIRKHAAFLEALKLLQARGRRLLLQVHDFAEDFRPEVFETRSAYPGSCAYATINSRDRALLMASGLEAAHVHLLPNPVALNVGFEPRLGYRRERERGRRSALYPVRAIRRKNLGEALLLSRFLPEEAEIKVTLPPSSPRDGETYALWKRVALDRGLHLAFEAGLGAELDALYGSAFCVLTTSVKEGFGYSYLDPLARGIPVVGREIPAVVADFRAQGLALPGLYRAIEVPRAALPAADLRAAVEDRIAKFRTAYTPVFAAAGRQGELEGLLAALAGRFESEYLDFGALDENLQAGLLREAEPDSELDRALRMRNPFLEGLFIGRPSEEEALGARAALAQAYSEESHERRLRAAYADAISGKIGGSVDRRLLLAGYLSPEFFYMVAA